MASISDMFALLTIEETRTLMRMLREGYETSRQSAKMLRAAVRENPDLNTPPTRNLLSANRGSFAGVRSELVMLSNDLIDHVRRLEMS